VNVAHQLSRTPLEIAPAAGDTSSFFLDTFLELKELDCSGSFVDFSRGESLVTLSSHESVLQRMQYIQRVHYGSWALYSVCAVSGYSDIAGRA